MLLILDTPLTCNLYLDWEQNSFLLHLIRNIWTTQIFTVSFNYLQFLQTKNKTSLINKSGPCLPVQFRSIPVSPSCSVWDFSHTQEFHFQNFVPTNQGTEGGIFTAHAISCYFLSLWLFFLVSILAYILA